MTRYLALTILLIGCSSEFDYPETEKKRGSYNVGGTTIYDPYIYMEDFQSEEVVNWSDNQNALTIDYLQDSSLKRLSQCLKMRTALNIFQSLISIQTVIFIFITQVKMSTIYI